MITVAEIKTKAQNIYPEYLRAALSGTNFFPKVIRSDKTASRDFIEGGKQKAELIENSKDRKGFGFSIKYRTVKTRQHSVQDVIDEIIFQTENDFLKFIHKENEALAFKTNSNLILKQFPELADWAKKNPLKIIQNDSNWLNLLKVCAYFKQWSMPNLYIRELPIKVHTKFIENHKGILFELLNEILNQECVNQLYLSPKDFEKRFGLKFNQNQIRIRILDKSISDKHLSGLTDITVTEEEFCNLQIPCEKVFILENKTNFSNLMNFLTLPQMQGTIGIFGSGFKVSNLKNASWLNNKDVFYWGDIDTHGLQILSQIRGYFKQTKSIMMDFETLNVFKEDWSRGEPISAKILPNLTAEEQQLFTFVKADNENTIRLEQEKITHEYVLSQISKLF